MERFERRSNVTTMIRMELESKQMAFDIVLADSLRQHRERIASLELQLAGLSANIEQKDAIILHLQKEITGLQGDLAAYTKSHHEFNNKYAAAFQRDEASIEAWATETKWFVDNIDANHFKQLYEKEKADKTELQQRHQSVLHELGNQQIERDRELFETRKALKSTQAALDQATAHLEAFEVSGGHFFHFGWGVCDLPGLFFTV